MPPRRNRRRRSSSRKRSDGESAIAAHHGPGSEPWKRCSSSFSSMKPASKSSSASSSSSAAATARSAAVPAVPVLVGCTLRRGDELGEHPCEGIHLVAAELGSGGGSREVLREHALEPEHQAVANLPARGRLREAGPHLLERVVEGGAACGPGCECGGRILVREGLAAPGRGAGRCRSQVFRCIRQQGRGSRGFVHVRSTYCGAAPSES